MSEPVKHAVYKLLSERTGEPVAWACEQCKVVICNNEPDARSHELVEACTGCGQSTAAEMRGRTYRVVCRACQSARWAEESAAREEAMLAKVEKIPMAEWTGECLSDGDERFWWSLDDALEHFDSTETPRPAYLHECDPETMTLSAERILEDALDEFHEDAGGDISAKDVARLQRFLDLWCKKVNVVTWRRSYRRIVMLEPCPADADGNEIEAVTDEIEAAS